MSTAFRVLIANEPRAYRETITQFLASMRPDFDAISEDPTDLDASIHRHAPSLVLCSRVTEQLLSTIPAWIVLYPEGASMVIASIGGRQRTMPDLDIDLLLALVDESATNTNTTG